MRSVIERNRNARHRDERGATLLIVAILTVVILGMTALVVDLGALHQERRELQNGADAAALAVARDCIDGDCKTGAAAAATYANANAGDNSSTVDQVCGMNKKNLGSIAGCAGVTAPTGANGYTRAKLSTRDARNGNAYVSFGFARIFGLTGKQIKAEAQVAWGSPKVGTGPPITVSECDFKNWISTKADISIYSRWNSLQGTYINDAGYPTSCGFTWLDSGPCTATNTVGSEPTEVAPKTNGTGNDTKWVKRPASCSKPTVQGWKNKLIRIPIFDSNLDCGGHDQYRVAGYALFRLTGYNLADDLEWNTTGLCPNGRCLRGHFEKIEEAAKGRFGGKDFGILNYRYFNLNDPDGNF